MKSSVHVRWFQDRAWERSGRSLTTDFLGSVVGTSRMLPDSTITI